RVRGGELEALDLLAVLRVLLREAPDLVVGIGELAGRILGGPEALALGRGLERLEERPQRRALLLGSSVQHRDTRDGAEREEQVVDLVRYLRGREAEDEPECKEDQERRELPEIHRAGPARGQAPTWTLRSGREPRSVEGPGARRA